MTSVLLGDRRLLSERLRVSLQETGTFHFLAISGLHVGILLVGLLRLPFPRGTRTTTLIVVLIGFTLLTGGAAPVVRASLMAALHLVGNRLERRPQAVNTLGWTALVLVALDPGNLGRPGFQLSFVAVFGIVTWGRLLTSEDDDLAARFAARSVGRRFQGVRTIVAVLKKSLVISVATSVVTAPLVLHYFERFHPLGPIWTVAVYPLAVLVLAGGLVSVTAGLVHPSLGYLFAAPTEWAATGMTTLLDVAASIPGSSIHLPPPPAWQTAAAYLILLVGLRRRSRKVALWSGVAALVVTAVFCVCIDRRPRLFHFDVGEGSAALLNVPGRANLLIDAGGRGPRAGDRLLRFILSTRVRHISGMYLTHAHDDHVSGVERILAALPIAAVYVSSNFEEFGVGRIVALLSTELGVPLTFLKRGDLVDYPGAPPLKVRVLFPQAVEELSLGRSANETSLALMIELGEARYLSLGDLEEEGVARLLSGGDDLRADVLVLPHHGRFNRRLPELLSAVEPGTVIISGSGAGGGLENAARLEAQGYEVFATWRGAVVSTWRHGGWETEQWTVDSR